MADELVKSITNKSVKDTVDNAKKEQDSLLDKLKSSVQSSTGFFSGLSETISVATNTINQSVSSITSQLDNSLKSFSSEVNTGLKTSLTDLTKKHGSMVSDVQGQTDKGAVQSKTSFITNPVSSNIDVINLVNGNDDLLKSFTDTVNGGNLDKLASTTGIKSISNGSSLSSAIKSSSGTLSDLTTGASSVLKSVASAPKSVISDISKSINAGTNSLLGSVKSSITEFTGVTNLGDLNTLVKDVYDIYSVSKDVYNVVSGKDTSTILGIASKFNNSFGEVTDLMNLASRICSTMNGNSLENYRSNKDLTDLLLKRMARQGMYGAIDQLMNCSDSQQYVDDRTYYVLAQELSGRATSGDVRTARAIYGYTGNSRVSNNDVLMYQLAYNMDDDEHSINDYTYMLSGMGMSGNSMTGVRYDNDYVYSSGRTNALYNKNPNLTNRLTGNSTTSAIVSLLSDIF